MGIYTTDQGLINLKNYKYHGIDLSILAKFFQPFWRFLASLLPGWLAPNTITLIGFLFSVASAIMMAYYCPKLEGCEDTPSIVFYLCALFMFVYQTMDALDGKQARQTRSSSPLGELFDHGCDALNTGLSAVVVAGSIQLGAGWSSFWFVTATLVSFYLAQWEEYDTGVLELGYINVTEAQVLVMLIHVISGYFGPGIWLSTFHLPITGRDYPWQIVPFEVGIIGNIITSAVSIVKVARRSPDRVASAIRLIPGIMFFGGLWAWAKFSPTHVLETQPLLFLWTAGFVAANLISRIVLARMCQMKYAVFHPLLVPLGVALLNCAMGGTLINEYYLLLFYTVGSLLAYLHFAVSVINDLCATLNIRCLRIPYPPPPEPAKKQM